MLRIEVSLGGDPPPGTPQPGEPYGEEGERPRLGNGYEFNGNVIQIKKGRILPAQELEPRR